MFGGDMMQKLQQMQQQAEQTKERLSQFKITGEAGGNLVYVEMNGNRKLEKITINTALEGMDKEDLEDLLVVAFNRAMEQVEKIQEQEMTASAKGLFPGM